MTQMALPLCSPFTLTCSSCQQKSFFLFILQFTSTISPACLLLRKSVSAGFGLSMGFVYSKTNIKYCQMYTLNCTTGSNGWFKWTNSCLVIVFCDNYVAILIFVSYFSYWLYAKKRNFFLKMKTNIFFFCINLPSQTTNLRYVRNPRFCVSL